MKRMSLCISNKRIYKSLSKEPCKIFLKFFFIIVEQPKTFIYCERPAHGQTNQEKNNNKEMATKAESHHHHHHHETAVANTSWWPNYYFLAFLFLLAIFFHWSLP